MIIFSYISIVTLNIKYSNQRHRVAEQSEKKKNKVKNLKKQDPTLCCLPEIYFSFKDTHFKDSHGLKVKEWISVVIPTSDKVVFNTPLSTLNR